VLFIERITAFALIENKNMSKLTTSQLTVLGSIKEAKKATKKAALTNAGNHITLKKLVEAGLVGTNEPSKKVTEVTYSLTDTGKAELKDAAKLIAKNTKLAAKNAKLAASKAPATAAV